MGEGRGQRQACQAGVLSSLLEAARVSTGASRRPARTFPDFLPTRSCRIWIPLPPGPSPPALSPIWALRPLGPFWGGALAADVALPGKVRCPQLSCVLCLGSSPG